MDTILKLVYGGYDIKIALDENNFIFENYLFFDRMKVSCLDNGFINLKDGKTLEYLIHYSKEESILNDNKKINRIFSSILIKEDTVISVSYEEDYEYINFYIDDNERISHFEFFCYETIKDIIDVDSFIEIISHLEELLFKKCSKTRIKFLINPNLKECFYKHEVVKDSKFLA